MAAYITHTLLNIVYNTIDATAIILNGTDTINA